MDPLGLFSSGKAEDKSDLIDYDYYYDEDNYLDYYDYRELLEKMDVSGSEQVLINQRPSGPSQSEKQRLAFVHYVYPETSKQDQHFSIECNTELCDLSRFIKENANIGNQKQALLSVQKTSW